MTGGALDGRCDQGAAPGAWRPERTEDGSWTLVHPVHGEACHSRSGAWLEAVERYARPCRLAELARARGRVRLLDIGTGPGINLAAALAAVEGAGGELDVVTLELERAPLETALELARAGVALGGPGEAWHAPVRAALELALAGDAAARATPLGRHSRLVLCLGDARATLPALEAERPLSGGTTARCSGRRWVAPPAQRVFDAVFLDSFSPRVAPELFEAEFLAEVARRMAPGSWLSTYTVSLPVRRRLVAAGLRVGAGPRVGRKREGTLASPDLEPPALDARTRRRLALPPGRR